MSVREKHSTGDAAEGGAPAAVVNAGTCYLTGEVIEVMSLYDYLTTDVT